MPDRPLLVTADMVLLDDLVRLAGEAGCDTQAAPDIGSAAAVWEQAPLVLLGVDVLEAAVRAGLPARPGVVVVSAGGEPGWVWSAAAALGADGVVALPGAEHLVIDRLVGLGASAAPPGRLVAVVGGRGGAGASTVACALAVAGAGAGGAGGHASDRARSGEAPPGRDGVMLVDLDPLGGGLDLILGAEEAPGLRWPDLAGTRGRTDPSELRSALPVVDGVTLLSWHRGPAVALSVEAVRSVFGAAREVNSLVVLDVPRSCLRSAEPLREVLSDVDVLLLVVPAEVRAVAAAAQVAGALTDLVRDVRLVVRGPSPAGLTGDLVAARLGLPLAGFVAAEPGLAGDLERGQAPGRSGKGPLARFCSGFAAELSVGQDGGALLAAPRLRAQAGEGRNRRGGRGRGRAA